MNENLQNFCPVCKKANDSNATICRYCRAPLNKPVPEEAPTTKHIGGSFGLSDEVISQITKASPPPSEGLLLFLLNNSEPIALCTDQEFVLGRDWALISMPLFDLSKYDAYAMGVSRTHAVIKAVDNGYVLVDLNSANGTWVNGERLSSGKPHPLPSGSVIQLGRLKLVVIYSKPPSP
jgi:hypothetical protein